MNTNYGSHLGGFNDEFFDDSDMSKFYGGIFMNPVPRHPITDEEKREAKHIVKMTHLGVALYLAICYLTIYLLSILFKGPLAEAAREWAENPTLFALIDQLLNAVPQYLIALPIVLLFLKNVRVTQYSTKSKMSIKELFTMLCIAEFLMIVGNIIGTSLNMTIEKFTGGSIENNVADMIVSTPVWLLSIFVVILAPIFEELIFRKLLMDRLLVLGDKAAIILTALAFGAFHGNLYQFFYATFVGLVFGYVYAKTRDIKYPIILHAIVNFLGSILAIPVIEAEEKLFEMLEIVEQNPEVDITPYFGPMMITMAYSILQYALIGFGVYALVKMIKNKRINLLRGEISLEKGTYADVIFKNLGVIIFYVLSVAVIIINLIPEQQINPEVIPDGAATVYKLLSSII